MSRDHLPDNTLKPEIVYPMLILPDDGPVCNDLAVLVLAEVRRTLWVRSVIWNTR